MTTNKHQVENLEDGGYFYRGIRFDRHDNAQAAKRYGAGFYHRIDAAPTIKAMTANIDAYLAAEEKAYTPVLRADGTYCSPRCGCGCTKAAHNEAHRLGAALAERMGPGWHASVWENCMWHYAANFDIEGVEVSLHHGHPPGKAREPHREGVDQYTCYINTNPQFIANSTDPRQAFELALQALEQHVAQLGSVAAILRNQAA